MVEENLERSETSDSFKRYRFLKCRSLAKLGFVFLFVFILASFFTLLFFPITQNYSKRYFERATSFLRSDIDPIYFDANVPSSFDVHGIDVSHHNKLIDWNLVKYITKSTDTLSFVFIKATEGRDHMDTMFIYNWNQSKQSNLIRGAYHYFKANVPADVQADFFIKTVPLVYGDLPPVIDVEESRFGWRYSLEEEVLKMAKRLEDHYKVKPIIYISHNFYELYFDIPAFDNFPFWIARYNNHHRLRNLNFWKFWQHTELGSVGGIKGAVDVNVFIGDTEDLKDITIK